MTSDARMIGPTERMFRLLENGAMPSVSFIKGKPTLCAVIDARETLQAIITDHEDYLRDKNPSVAEGIRRRGEQTACRRVITILDTIINAKRVAP